jgi:hypothetical protein
LRDVLGANVFDCCGFNVCDEKKNNILQPAKFVVLTNDQKIFN